MKPQMIKKFIFLYVLPVIFLLAVFRYVFSFETNLPLVIFISLLGLMNYLLLNMAFSKAWKVIDAQKKLMAHASHDLRNPLSIVKTNSEVVLMEGSRGRASIEEALQTIKSNLEEIDRMNGMLKDFLDPRKVEETGKEILYPKFSIFGSVARFVRKFS